MFNYRTQVIASYMLTDICSLLILLTSDKFLIYLYGCACFCSEIKERIKKTKDEKKAKKAELMSKTQKTQTKSNMPKGGKGPKLGGGGGKR